MSHLHERPVVHYLLKREDHGERREQREQMDRDLNGCVVSDGNH